VAECRDCRRKIIWARTASGKKIPLDPSPPATGGKFELLGKHNEGLPLAVASKTALLRYTYHHETCPSPRRPPERKDIDG
jgi:hypothetical protein